MLGRSASALPTLTLLSVSVFSLTQLILRWPQCSRAMLDVKSYLVHWPGIKANW